MQTWRCEEWRNRADSVLLWVVNLYRLIISGELTLAQDQKIAPGVEFALCYCYSRAKLSASEPSFMSIVERYHYRKHARHRGLI